MASCLYFCPNVFLLPCAVPYASIFCIIVHGIVFFTVFLNLPPAWHLIQRNHGLQAYNILQKRTRTQTQSIPDIWHWHCCAHLPDQEMTVSMHDLPLHLLPSKHVICMQDPTFDCACEMQSLIIHVMPSPTCADAWNQANGTEAQEAVPIHQGGAYQEGMSKTLQGPITTLQMDHSFQSWNVYLISETSFPQRRI